MFHSFGCIRPSTKLSFEHRAEFGAKAFHFRFVLALKLDTGFVGRSTCNCFILMISTINNSACLWLVCGISLESVSHLLDVHPIVEFAHHVPELQRSWEVIDHILGGEVAIVLVVQRLRDEVPG